MASSAAQSADYVAAIGLHAGAVWRALHGTGLQSLPQLKKGTKLSEAEVREAIGWLAREGKLAVERKEKELVVRLK